MEKGMRSTNLACDERNSLPNGKVHGLRLPLRKHSYMLWLAALATLTLIALAACGNQQPEARVFFAEPQNGAQVKSPFVVKMAAEGAVIEPASNDLHSGNAHSDTIHGHHHIIVDAVLPNLEQPIPDESIQHLHFGKAQTETILDLEPGPHTLRLLFAKGDHVPWQPVVSDTIEITVVD